MAKKKATVEFVMWAKPNFTQIVRTHKNYKTNFHGAMLYAHYELSAIDLKKEVVKYLKGIDPKHPLLEKIKDLHENRLTTVGKYFYVINNGGEIPLDVLPKLLPDIERTLREEEEKQERLKAIEAADNRNTISSTTFKGTISIQDRLREKSREVAGEVEGWLDEFLLNKKSEIKSVQEFSNLFKANSLKSAHMGYVRAAFERRGEEVAEAVEGKDKLLSEAYSNFTKPELKKLLSFYTNLFAACDMIKEVAKVERAPRKKKPVSVEKLVGKLKFKKDDISLGIVSLAASSLIGAKEAWVYNTKTRKLSYYKASSEQGINVKGASLIDFSAESAEKTLRKPAETLAEFKKASKVKLRTFLKDLTTLDTVPTGKINEHHILLRVDK
jgi:hypothetical protein